MVVCVMTEDGDRLVDLDELKLFGMFRECDKETEKEKYGKERETQVWDDVQRL